jgi:hypothetical protein
MGHVAHFVAGARRVDVEGRVAGVLGQAGARDACGFDRVPLVTPLWFLLMVVRFPIPYFYR